MGKEKNARGFLRRYRADARKFQSLYVAAYCFRLHDGEETGPCEIANAISGIFSR